MLRVQPEGPYHLLGWSLGGQIAHAVAVRLRARGATVAVLAMLDSVVVPATAEPPPVPRMRDLLTHLLGDEPENADAAPDVTAAEAAAELARAGASFGTGLSADQLERLHRGYAAGVALSHGYRPGVYDGDLLYFSATRGITELLGAYVWRPYVTGELVEHPVAATHAQLTNSEVVAVIGPLLAEHLERTDAAGSARTTVLDRLPTRPRDAATSATRRV
ncbi:thioesterase domain-containing protein [Nocardia sp. N2S4-5]|uniref:thioesterase domain-containing protein n=1 Tax=Nocardia sp. N2S4-5 TaxID=3351565 RepID=UPI0037CEACE3